MMMMMMTAVAACPLVSDDDVRPCSLGGACSAANSENSAEDEDREEGNQEDCPGRQHGVAVVILAVVALALPVT